MHPVLPKSKRLPVVQPPEEDSEEPHQLRSFGCLGTAVLPPNEHPEFFPQNSVQLNTRPMILVGLVCVFTFPQTSRIFARPQICGRKNVFVSLYFQQ